MRGKGGFPGLGERSPGTEREKLPNWGGGRPGTRERGSRGRVGRAPRPPAPTPRSLSMPGKGSGCAPSCCSTAISKSNLMWSTLAMISCMVAVAAAATPARLPLRSPAALTPLPAVGPAAHGPPPPRLAAAAAAAAARGMLGAPGARAGPFACPDSANQAQSTGRSARPG